MCQPMLEFSDIQTIGQMHRVWLTNVHWMGRGEGGGRFAVLDCQVD